MKAPQAAGKIHTDFERGFIRAEVVAYDDLVSCGGMLQAKEKGLVRSEGKEYAGVFFAKDINVAQVLKDNDSYHALEAVGGLIITGPTGTNVNDFACVLVE